MLSGRSPEKTRTPRARRSLHSVEGFLQQLQVSWLAELFARVVDPFLFERVFGGTIGLKENSEHSREWQRCQLVGGELIGDVVAELDSLLPTQLTVRATSMSHRLPAGSIVLGSGSRFSWMTSQPSLRGLAGSKAPGKNSTH